MSDYQSGLIAAQYLEYGDVLFLDEHPNGNLVRRVSKEGTKIIVTLRNNEVHSFCYNDKVRYERHPLGSRTN